VSTRVAAAVYFGLSIVLTWPLSAGLASDVPGDLGDSLLNMWILAWGAEHVPRLLTGGMSWQAFWNANIFHPEPFALGFSEHLFGQTLQILPVYWLTGNIILAYNLIFLSTFALSGLGAYLLVRDLTGDRRAAFIAGLVYGFLPYRIASLSHVQVLSAQWMPFALYGFNRFVCARATEGCTEGRDFSPGRHTALFGGTAALVMQNWSCGYYALYFAPFVPAFVVHRMWAAGRLRDLRCWALLAGAAVATSVLSIPFLVPYAEAQQAFGFERPLDEIVRFSASAWSYLTASGQVQLWGSLLRFDTRSESDTFLGFMPWLLAAVAIGALVARREPGMAVRPGAIERRFAWLTPVMATVLAVQAAALAIIVFGGASVTVLGVSLSARSPVRTLVQLGLTAAVLLAVSPAARDAAGRLGRSPVGFFAGALMVAIWLSFGPRPAFGKAGNSALGLYNVLYAYVPGFNGVRVPARYAMIAGLFLSVLAGYGVTELLRSGRIVARVWTGTLATAIVAGLVLVEGAGVPLHLNDVWTENEATPPGRVYPASGAPPVYASVAELPEGSVITEFPFGDPAWEIRYVYYSHAHWKPITNGYSGAFPRAYQARVARWRRIDADPAGAWNALLESGTTHVVVHTAAFANPADATLVESWLHANNAVQVQRFPDGDNLFRVRYLV